MEQVAGLKAYLRERRGCWGAELQLAVCQGTSQQLAAQRAQALRELRGRLAAELPRAARWSERILCILQLQLLRPRRPTRLPGRAHCPTASKQAQWQALADSG